MILVLSFAFSIVPMPSSLPVVGALGPSRAEASSSKTLGDLALGDRVIDSSCEWEHKTGLLPSVAASQLDISEGLTTQNLTVNMMTDAQAVAYARDRLQIDYAP